MPTRPDGTFGFKLPLRRYSDRSGRPTREEPLAVGVPLTKLIKRSLNPAPEIVMLAQPRSQAAEEFRRLKTVLINQTQGKAQVIVVTSPTPSEGKSTLATNLALAFAVDERTLLLDADLRRPSIARLLQPPPQLGVGEILAGRTVLDHVLLELSNTPLHILPSGHEGQNPIELLGSDRARELIATLRERYQRVVIDTAPIVPFPDADTLGALSDGVLMIARSGVTPCSAYRRALASVTSTRILGAVLNDVTKTLADWNRYSDSYYYDYYDKERR